MCTLTFWTYERAWSFCMFSDPKHRNCRKCHRLTMASTIEWELPLDTMDFPCNFCFAIVCLFRPEYFILAMGHVKFTSVVYSSQLHCERKSGKSQWQTAWFCRPDTLIYTSAWHGRKCCKRRIANWWVWCFFFFCKHENITWSIIKS